MQDHSSDEPRLVMNFQISARSGETAPLLRNREPFHRSAQVFFFGGSSLAQYVIGSDRCNFQQTFESSSVSVVRESPERAVLPQRIGQTGKLLNIHAGFLRQE